MLNSLYVTNSKSPRSYFNTIATYRPLIAIRTVCSWYRSRKSITKPRVRVRGFIDCYIGRSTFTPDPVRAEISQALFPKPRGKVFQRGDLSDERRSSKEVHERGSAMLKAKGVPPPYRSCFPMISVDKQTPPCIPAKADRASTGWNSPISKMKET